MVVAARSGHRVELRERAGEVGDVELADADAGGLLLGLGDGSGLLLFLLLLLLRLLLFGRFLLFLLLGLLFGYLLLLLLLLLRNGLLPVVVVIVAAADQGDAGSAHSGARASAEQGSAGKPAFRHAVPIVSLAHESSVCGRTASWRAQIVTHFNIPAVHTLGQANITQPRIAHCQLDDDPMISRWTRLENVCRTRRWESSISSCSSSSGRSPSSWTAIQWRLLR